MRALLLSLDNVGPGMTLNRGPCFWPAMIMMPNGHAPPLLLSPDNVGPGVALDRGLIGPTMVMIPINHAPPSYCHLTMWGQA